MLCASHPLAFGDFRFNVRTRELLRSGCDGSMTPIPLGSRAAEILLLMLQRHGELLSKNEIMTAVWPDTAVEDSNLTVQISALRRALDEGRDGASCIQTAPGRGYRFTLPVVEENGAGAGGPVAGAAAPVPDKPSIAVLPFQNMSGDPEQDYFADGMVEDVITAPSRMRWLFVIARNSTFTYKGKAVDVEQVGRELGVRYVLKGSVRKA